MIRIDIADSVYRLTYTLQNGLNRSVLLQRNLFISGASEREYLFNKVSQTIFKDKDATYTPNIYIIEEVERVLIHPQFIEPRFLPHSMDPLSPIFTRANPTAEELQYQRNIRGSRDPMSREVMYHLDQFREEVSRCRKLIDELSDKLASKEDDIESLRERLIEVGLDV